MLFGAEEPVIPVLLVGLASGVACLAVTSSGLFEPVRNRLTGRLGMLVRCSLCLGFWACGALWAIQPLPPGLTLPVAWGASWAVSTATAWLLEDLHG